MFDTNPRLFRTPITLLTIAALSAPLIYPWTATIVKEKRYDYSEERFSITDEGTPSASASLLSLPDLRTSVREMRFDMPKDTVYVSVPQSDSTGRTEITVTTANGEMHTAESDDDGESKDGQIPDGKSHLVPILLSAPTDTITVRILTHGQAKATGTEVVAIARNAVDEHWALLPEKLTAKAASSGLPGITVVKRSEWGADETLRYKDHPTWKKAYERIETAEKTPSQIASETRILNIRSYLRTNFPEDDKVIKTVREEAGHDLVWPIERTKTVGKIVIHHTAENNTTGKTDEEIMRATYYYHTMVRGWGDIWYNYVVGESGTVYEGRAGGDYASAAHALWNNKSTVGVSMMGNFEVNQPKEAQIQAVTAVTKALSKKYGIDISGESTGHIECKSAESCLLKDYPTKNLIGHRDVGYTSCPGWNMYNVLWSVRAETTQIWKEGGLLASNSTGSVLSISGATAGSGTTMFTIRRVENPEVPDPETPLVVDEAMPTNPGPDIRIRLSFSGTSASVKAYNPNERYKLSIWTKNGTVKKNVALTIEAGLGDSLYLRIGKKRAKIGKEVTFSGSVLTVDNWDRKPSWDKTGKMNDNAFRGRIRITNENGKLLLVNILPIEHYLLGLAEVSNGDNPEKIKTILTAARTYAYFYSDPKNRKFPGKSYDGSDNPDEFQKYLGYGYELRSPFVWSLAKRTSGELITLGGSVIKPWYFNESDGSTLSYKQYCELRKSNGTLPSSTVCEDIPYLQSVTDPGSVGHTRKGHWVGISGLGSTYLATEMGFDYQKIIAYYLDGVKVEKKY